MRILRPSVLAAMAAASLAAAPGGAAPSNRVRVIVGDMAIDKNSRHTRDAAITLLQDQFEAFLRGINVKNGAGPQVVFWDPPTNPEKFRFSKEDIRVLAVRLAKDEADVLAYLWGSVRPGNQTGGDVAQHTVFIRSFDQPHRFVAAKASMLPWKNSSYEHMYIIAYATMLQAYRAKNFELAVAIADQAKRHREGASRSHSAKSPCFNEVYRAIQTVRAKADLRILAARNGSAGGVPESPASLPDPMHCN